jgi:hypothetical protein
VATLITAGSLLAALIGLYRLAELSEGRRVASLAVLALLTFPTAFFLVAPYAEAPLIALGVWSFIAARRRHWWLAGLLAGAAVLVKLYAVVIVAALIVELVDTERARRALRLLPLLVVPAVLSLGSWIAYQAVVYHEPLRFIGAERAWGRQLSLPMSFAWPAIDYFADWRDLPALVCDLAAPVLLVGLGIYAFFRVRRAYGTLMILSGLLFASTNTHFSVSRYALGAFPLYIIIGRLFASRPRLTLALPPISAALGATLLVLFVTGWFVG